MLRLNILRGSEEQPGGRGARRTKEMNVEAQQAADSALFPQATGSLSGRSLLRGGMREEEPAERLMTRVSSLES